MCVDVFVFRFALPIFAGSVPQRRRADFRTEKQTEGFRAAVYKQMCVPYEINGAALSIVNSNAQAATNLDRIKQQPVVVSVSEYGNIGGIKILEIATLLNILINVAQKVDAYRKTAETVAGLYLFVGR